MRTILRAALNRMPRLAQLYRANRECVAKWRPESITPWGFVLAGNDQMARGEFEENETRLVRELLKQADVFVNIGANIGYYCCHALSLGKPTIAIEPVSHNLFYLLKNLSLNGWSCSAEIYPVAVGGGNNILQMWGGDTGASLVKGWASIPENYVNLVPVLSLDNIVGNRLKGKKVLILADMEGAELLMLEGAKQTLRNEPRPTWMLEISSTANQPHGQTMNPNFRATFEEFFKLNYQAFPASNLAKHLDLRWVDDIINCKIEEEDYNYVFK